MIKISYVFFKTAIFFLATLFGLAGMAHAQPLSISLPSNGVRLAAGSDYATDILGDPWDMSNHEDISIDPDDRSGWSTFNFQSDGTVGGTTVALPGGGVDTTITLLNRGYYKIVNVGRTGQKYPIDTSVYKKIAFKMRSGIAGQLPAVYGFHKPPGDVPGYGSIFTQNTTVVGDKVHFANLDGTPAEGEAWSTAPAIGLRIDPNGTQAGYDVFLDWVRLTRADNDPLASILPISWGGGTGYATIDVLDASQTTILWNVASNATSPSNWNYGVLPAGNYVLRIKSGTETSSVTFQINNPPQVQVLDPSEVGGEDFATTILNNPWDMNSSQDANVTHSKDIDFSNGILSASNITSDPGVILHNNNEIAIDTSRYRYLSYRMKLDGSYDIGRGSVARVFWSSVIDADAPRMTTSRDVIAWPGKIPSISDFVTYTIDLGQLTVQNGGLEATGTQQEWGAVGSVRHFRIDPHEFTTERRFHFDYVTLAAMRETRGTFTIKYATSYSNIGDASATVSLYYALDKTVASRRLIATNLPLSPTGQHTWNTSNITPGDYYIYAEVNDDLNKTGSYSSGLLRVLPGVVSDAPVITGSILGSGRVTIIFSVPQNNGGTPIINYFASCTAPGHTSRSNSGASSPITVGHLTGGVSYSCIVQASNSAGTSTSSIAYLATPFPAKKNTLATILLLSLE